MNITNIILLAITCLTSLILVLVTTLYTYYKHKVTKHFTTNDTKQVEIITSNNNNTNNNDNNNQQNKVNPSQQIIKLQSQTSDYMINYNDLIFGSLLGKGSQGM